MTSYGPNRRGGYDYGLSGSYDYGMPGNYDYGAFLPHTDAPTPESMEHHQYGRPYTPGQGQSQGRRGPHAGKGPRRTERRLQEDVEDRLTNHDWLDASGIQVQVSGDEVTLSGTVRSRQDKRLAEDIAESVPGIIDVHNQLRIAQE